MVNGVSVKAMVDTGTTHSFMVSQELNRLKLQLRENGFKIKVVKYEARPVQGLANADIKIGSWSRSCNMMEVPLDDYNLILGKEFMTLNKIFPICMG